MQSTSLWSLRRDPEFFTRAKSMGNRSLVLYYEAAPDIVTTQTAVIVPKTVAPLSVDRHLLKRRLAHLLRQARLTAGRFVIVVKRSATQESFAQLKTSLEDLLSKTHLIHD